MILPNPVWPAVKVCSDTNLVAFRNAGEAKSYYERNCPSIPIKELYLCDSCRQFHAITGDAKPPSAWLNAKDQFAALRKTLK